MRRTLARRRYLRVDPDNRLVADALEADWNDKLRALTQAQEDYRRRRGADDTVLGPQQRERIIGIGQRLPGGLERDGHHRQGRKRMLRLLLEDVTLVKGQQALNVHVRFRGGDTRSVSLPRPLPSWKTWLTPAETVVEIDRLLAEHTDGKIAEILNERGFRSGQGHRFHGGIVSKIRLDYGLRSRHERLVERGMVSADELASIVGVSHQTVLRWRRSGLVLAHPYNDKGQYLYDPSGGIPPEIPRWPRISRQDPAADGIENTKEVQCEA